MKEICEGDKLKIYDLEERMIEILKDAGCSHQQIGEFMELYRQGKIERLYILLEKHRRKILENLHKTEREIDCLDYLVYQMKKQEEVEK